MKSFFLTCFLFSTICVNVSRASDPALSQHQKDVITYFKEVALGFEYGSASGVTRKWKAPMKLFVEGKTTDRVLLELDRVIAELNSLTSDGFYIERVGSKDASNMHVFFGSRSDFATLYPSDRETIKNSSGIFRIFWNKNNQITRGYIFIHNLTSEREQRHAIREELTQALGLGKDSPTYAESVFQSRWTLPTEFLEIDRELIRFLYHPQMRVGLRPDEVDRVLTEIYLSEITIDSPLQGIADRISLE